MTRRSQAIHLARDINTMQIRQTLGNHPFLPLEQLAITAPIPNGFTVHLASNGPNYSFSLKDTLDPCGFAVFSDEDGRIYTGEVIR